MRLSFFERVRALKQEPIASVKMMGMSEGQKVVDIGAGSGYLTIPAALAVGMRGIVYSVEPNPTKSDRIMKRVAGEGLQNVRVLETGAEELQAIPSDSIDFAFSAFSIHHFNDRQVALSEIRRVLKKGGTFYVWDRVPGWIVRHGTRVEELSKFSDGFEKFELLGTRGTVRARFTK